MPTVRKVLLIAACIAAFFVNNGSLMTDIMESRNIVTAREMVYDGHWLVTTMNGDYRFEKPPLPTWLAALAEIIAPDSMPVQRAMAGLAALMLVFFVYRFAQRVLGLSPLIASLLLITSYSVILMGRTASWDIYCHAFMMGGIYYLALALLPPGAAATSATAGLSKNFLLSGLFIGLSLMSKGPVSLFALFLPFIVCFVLVYRPSMRGRWPGIALLVVVALIVGGWWYAYIYLFHANELASVLSKETGAWAGRNVRPWWYYWKFFLEAGVWAAVLLTAIVVPIVSPRSSKRAYIFSVAWTLAVVVLLSFMPEKKSRYLLPMLIPAAFAMTGLIEYWRHNTTLAKWTFRANTWLIAVAVLLLPVGAYIALFSKGYMALWQLCAFTAFFVVIALCLLRVAVRRQPRCVVYTVALLFFGIECFAMPYFRCLFNNTGQNSIAATRNIPELRSLPFYYNQNDPLRIELVYAAAKKIRPLDLNCRDSIINKLPCAVLTHKPLAQETTADVLQGIDTCFVDRYDDNRTPSGHRRHSDLFIYDLTILQ